MAPKQYQNAPFVRLSDYISADRFRTVLHKQYEEPHGLSEIPVEIELGDELAKLLSFRIPWDKWLYGFVRRNVLLNELNNEDGVNSIKLISIHDWDGKLLMVIDAKKGEIPCFVKPEEVKELLENCLRPPQQQSGYLKD